MRNRIDWELHSRHVSRISQEVFMTKVSVAVILSSVALLSGCAATLKKLSEPKLSYTEYAGEPVKSFYMRNTDNGWSPVSKNQLVVWSGINEAYLIKVFGYCPDLRFADAVGVTNAAGTVDKFEKVIVGQSAASTPITSPSPQSFMPSAMKRPTMLAAVAPQATRTPISAVRVRTARAIRR